MILDSRPRLLMLTHRFPYPPNRGDRIRSYNLLRVLSQHYRVTLGCTSEESVSTTNREHVNQFCENTLIATLAKPKRLVQAFHAYVNGRSLTEGMFRSQWLQREINALQRQHPFDAALVYCSSMFSYVDQPLFQNTRTVVDLVDVDSQKWAQMSSESTLPKSWLYGSESSRVRKLEQRIATQADAVALVSESEASLFNATITAKCDAQGISNGVDNEYFGPKAKPSSTERSRATKLVFTGVLDYHPNVEGLHWFCNNVLPRLLEQKEIELAIVGRRPNARVKDLATLPGVRLVGEVPDVRPYLHEADIAISPLSLARGIQNKVLEAMSTGLPVVVSSQSAEGIDAQSQVHFWIADSIDEWEQAVLRIANDPGLQSSIGRSARQLVGDHYSWEARLKGFLSLLANCPPEECTRTAALNANTQGAQ